MHGHVVLLQIARLFRLESTPRLFALEPRHTDSMHICGVPLHDAHARGLVLAARLLACEPRGTDVVLGCEVSLYGACPRGLKRATRLLALEPADAIVPFRVALDRRRRTFTRRVGESGYRGTVGRVTKMVVVARATESAIRLHGGAGAPTETEGVLDRMAHHVLVAMPKSLFPACAMDVALVPPPSVGSGYFVGVNGFGTIYVAHLSSGALTLLPYACETFKELGVVSNEWYAKLRAPLHGVAFEYMVILDGVRRKSNTLRGIWAQSCPDAIAAFIAVAKEKVNAKRVKAVEQGATAHVAKPLAHLFHLQ